jgi:CheY-like chemotaxis protein
VSTILVVDDYPDALQVWDLYLQASGFGVLTADAGAAGLALATTELPDLIVLDLEMPRLSGIEVARALNANESTRKIPKIAVTGYSLPRQLEEARRAGFDAVLVKPCDPDDLLATIHRLLDDGPDAGAPPEKVVAAKR